jgi:hypothetical protein
MKIAPLVILGLGLGLAAGCRSTQPRPTTKDTAVAARPATPEACKACNGQWGRHGLANVEGCLCRTKDAGKVCKTTKDCESQCVARDQPDTEIVEKGPPAKGFFLGQCHEFATYFGCGRLLRDKVTAGAPVLLGEPPLKICVD